MSYNLEGDRDVLYQFALHNVTDLHGVNGFNNRVIGVKYIYNALQSTKNICGLRDYGGVYIRDSGFIYVHFADPASTSNGGGDSVTFSFGTEFTHGEVLNIKAVVSSDSTSVDIYKDEIKIGTVVSNNSGWIVRTHYFNYNFRHQFTIGKDMNNYTVIEGNLNTTIIQAIFDDHIFNFTEGTGTTSSSEDGLVDLTLHSDTNEEYMWSYQIEDAPNARSINLSNATGGQGRIDLDAPVPIEIGDVVQLWIKPLISGGFQHLVDNVSSTHAVFFDYDILGAIKGEGFDIEIFDTDGNALPNVAYNLVGKVIRIVATATVAGDIDHIGNAVGLNEVFKGEIYDYKIKTIHFTVDEGKPNSILNADGAKTETATMSSYNNDIWTPVYNNSKNGHMAMAMAMSIPSMKNKH